jgi:hypothetical protein
MMAALIAFRPALMGLSIVDVPWTSDIGYQWVPFAAFIKRCYLAGVFPLWDPHDLCGMPFLAFSHTGSLYAPAVIANLLAGSYSAAMAFDAFAHLSLAAIFAFMLFRVAGRSAPACFCAAIAYAFSGFFFSNLNFPPSLHTAPWLALWFAAGFALLCRASLFWFLLCAASFAAMIYAGDLELIVFAVLGLGFELLLRRQEDGLRPGPLIVIVLAVIAGALISSPQLVPASELLHLSIRSGEAFVPSVNALVALAMPAFALFQIPMPQDLLPPNHGLDPWYLGAFFILLSAYGLRKHAYARRRLLAFPAAAIYVTLMYTPPLNLVCSRIPVLGGLLVPFRVWPVLEIFFLLAATYSLDAWIKGEESALADAPANDPRPSGKPLPLGRAGSLFLVIFAAATALSLIKIHHGMAMRLCFCAVLVAAGAMAWSRPDALSSPRAKAALVVILVVSDLYLLALAWQPMTPRDKFKVDPRLSSLLANTSAKERYAIISIFGIIDPDLPFHLGLRLNAATIDAFTRVPPRLSSHRLALLYPSLFNYRGGRLVHYDQMAVRDLDKLDLARLDLVSQMNVAWIISRYPWEKGRKMLGLKPILSDPDLYIYRNPSALPRAFSPEGGRDLPRAVAYPAPDRVEVEAAPGLTLSDSWYPGWRAFEGDREIPVARTELGFRRVSSSGPYPVSMRYEPTGFRLGLFAGMAAAACWALTALFRAVKRKYNPS